MYFERDQVVSLLQAVARRFGRGELFFDTIPPWFSRKTLRGWAVTKHYTAPPMPFGLALGELKAFLAEVPALSALRVLTYAEPYPRRMRLFALISRVPWLKDRIAPGLVHARIATAAETARN
jgi:O-methyltransferase involved in polyketide biosynthesis